MLDRPKPTIEEWMETRRPPAERLVRFEQWLRKQLVDKLQWSRDPVKRDRQIGQCQQFVNGFLVDLNSRGWLFDGPILAKIVTEKIEAIAARQKAGQVIDIWVYFRTCWRDYADAAAEKLHDQARSAGYHVSQALRGLKTIPEMAAQRQTEITREKLAKARQRTKEEAAAADQLPLL
jgi:hypothetical protein